MTKTKYFLGIATLAIGISGLFLFNAPAQESGSGTRTGDGRLARQAKEKLGLTDQQLGQIKDIFRTEKSSITNLLGRMRDSRAGLRAAIRAADANETSVRAASAKVAAVEADAAVERMKIFHEISPILTEEQRQKLATMQSNLDGFMDQAIQRIDARLGE